MVYVEELQKYVAERELEPGMRPRVFATPILKSVFLADVKYRNGARFPRSQLNCSALTRLAAAGALQSSSRAYPARVNRRSPRRSWPGCSSSAAVPSHFWTEISFANTSHRSWDSPGNIATSTSGASVLSHPR